MSLGVTITFTIKSEDKLQSSSYFISNISLHSSIQPRFLSLIHLHSSRDSDSCDSVVRSGSVVSVNTRLVSYLAS